MGTNYAIEIIFEKKLFVDNSKQSAIKKQSLVGQKANAITKWYSISINGRWESFE